jgi:hypothetical protein
MLCGIFSVISLQRSGCREAKGKLTMRSLLMLVAICFSATAFAQSALPKVGNKSLVQVKPKEPMGCKLVGSVRGTKLWAGDCVGSELRARQLRRKRNPCLSKRPDQSRPIKKSDAARPQRHTSEQGRARSLSRRTSAVAKSL